MRETAKRSVRLQNQEIGDGENLLVVLRKTGLEVRLDARRFPNRIQKMTRAEESALHLGDWGGASLLSLFPIILHSFLRTGRDNLTRLRIEFPNQLAFRPGLLLLLVPVGFVFIDIRNTALFVLLIDYTYDFTSLHKLYLVTI